MSCWRFRIHTLLLLPLLGARPHLIAQHIFGGCLPLKVLPPTARLKPSLPYMRLIPFSISFDHCRPFVDFHLHRPFVHFHHCRKPRPSNSIASVLAISGAVACSVAAPSLTCCAFDPTEVTTRPLHHSRHDRSRYTLSPRRRSLVRLGRPSSNARRTRSFPGEKDGPRGRPGCYLRGRAAS